MRIKDAVGVITGAAAGIGREVALELARREVHGLALVDYRGSVVEVARNINTLAEDWISFSFRGDVTDDEFRRTVFRETEQRCGPVSICVGAPACRRGQSGHVQLETAVLSPVSWALEMVEAIGRCQTDDDHRTRREVTLRGVVVLFGAELLFHHQPHPVCATAKARIRQARKLLMAEAHDYGIACAMVLSKGFGFPALHRGGGRFRETVFPTLSMAPLTSPKTIAQAVCRAIANSTDRGFASEDVLWPGLG